MITWSGHEWLTQERWGQIHPDKTICWYDASCVEIDQYGYLHLKTKYNPKTFNDLNITSNVGIGLVSCTTKLYHGVYEIEAKLPRGKNLWPAFWMYSFDSWPPEIDVFEAYTVNDSSYFTWNPFKPWNVQTNIHYNEKSVIKSIGSNVHYWGYKDPSKNFIKYKVDWQRDYIKFYYNDYMVRCITDKSILDQFNRTTMNVILNNSIDSNVDINNPPISDFIIKYFKHY